MLIFPILALKVVLSGLENGRSVLDFKSLILADVIYNIVNLDKKNLDKIHATCWTNPMQII